MKELLSVFRPAVMLADVATYMASPLQEGKNNHRATAVKIESTFLAKEQATQLTTYNPHGSRRNSHTST